MSPSIDFEESGPLEFAKPETKPTPFQEPGKKIYVEGEVKDDDLEIFIPSSVLDEVIEHSYTDLSHELGGIFVGDLYEWKGRPYVEIAGYIPATRYENTAASFTFTHDTWRDVSRAADERFGSKLRLGWHHTHPGYGVFLSGHDRFIHENFFDLPYMFAMVVDPRSGKLGFFQTKNGEIAPVGFYVVE